MPLNIYLLKPVKLDFEDIPQSEEVSMRLE